MLLRWFLAWPWKCRRFVFPKCRLTFARLHGGTPQKITLSTGAYHWSLSWATLAQSTLFHPISLRFNLIYLPICPWMFLVASSLKKSSIFCNITPCSPLKVNWRFEGTCPPLSSASSTAVVVTCWCLAWLILWLRRWRWRFPPKRRLTFNGLHGVIPQKIRLFITATVRT
jgi:hypothetical protein